MGTSFIWEKPISERKIGTKPQRSLFFPLAFISGLLIFGFGEKLWRFRQGTRRSTVLGLFHEAS